MDGGKYIKQLKLFFLLYIERIERRVQLDLKYFLKNTPSLLTVTIVSTVFGLISSIILTRLLSKDLYGTYLYVLTLIGTISIFSVTGMSTAVQRDASRNLDGILVEGTKIRFKWSLVGSVVLIAGGIYYLSTGDVLLGKCLLIASAFFPFLYSFDTFLNFIMGKMYFNKYALFKTIIIISNTLAILGAIIITKDIFWAITAYLISFSVVQIYLWRKTVQKDKENDSVDDESIHYGKVLTLQGTIPMLANQFDSIIIANFLGMGDLAIFTIALYIGNFATVPLDIISNLIFPKIAARGNDEGTALVFKKLKYVLALSIVICGIFAIIVPFLIPLLYSAKYQDSVFYAQIILIATVVFSPGAVLNQMLKAQGRSREMLRILIASRVVEIALFIIMIPLLGLLGAALVRILNNLGFTLISYYIIKKSF